MPIIYDPETGGLTAELDAAEAIVMGGATVEFEDEAGALGWLAATRLSAGSH